MARPQQELRDVSRAGAELVMPVVSVFAVSGIQSYVFRSNKLKENVGASALVERAVGAGLQAIASSRQGRSLYAAGGKAAWVFDNELTARAVTYEWSRDLLVRSPGLRVSAAHVEYAPGGLAAAHGEAFARLEAVQEAPNPAVPLLALPIVRTCATTGLPATTRSTPDEFLSAEADHKRRASAGAHELFEDRFGGVLRTSTFPVEMSDLGGIEGDSRVAVVHADGNEMGARLKAFAGEGVEDAPFEKRMKDFTDSVRTAGEAAFRSVLTVLASAIPDLESRGILRLKANTFPLRPLVVGGDDLTFVCDARLGLTLAACFLHGLEKLPVADGRPMDACAGVAIVGTGFPFARAYGLAEELCASAKAGRREARLRSPQACGSWIDFQIVRSGAGGALTETRARGMSDPDGKDIHRRPWPLKDDSRRDWAWFEGALAAFSGWPRSRAKALLGAFEDGRDAVEREILDAESRGLRAPGSAGAKGPDVGYLFDPLDALDVGVNL